MLALAVCTVATMELRAAVRALGQPAGWALLAPVGDGRRGRGSWWPPCSCVASRRGRRRPRLSLDLFEGL